MNIFKRLFKITQAESHSALDKLEDPIKMTEQGIRDMRNNLDNSLKALAEVKALSIRAKSEMETYSAKAQDYEKKAVLLVQKAESGDLSAEESDRLAVEALTKKEENEKLAQVSKSQKDKYDQSIAQMDQNIKTLRSNISTWENELKTLKARVKISSATKNINKQMANIDSSSTVAMLERLKDKVAQEEALAESYGEIANESKSVDEEINKALGDENKNNAQNALEALKAKLNTEK